ncbi:MAG: hypothetical protein LBU78_13890 [Microbacterium sp.]|nr:hypothetical protein [Microbacterium sp.]
MTAQRPRRWIAGAALASAALLAGCGNVDAGSGARDAFIAYMADVPGVTGADASMSNDLPFRGSGDFEVELDASSDEKTLDAALDHAAAFPVPSGVSVDLLKTSISTPAIDIGIDTLWGSETSGIAERALALTRIPDLTSYVEELDGVYHADPELTISIDVSPIAPDPCVIAAAVAQATGTSVADIQVHGWKDQNVAELTCG